MIILAGIVNPLAFSSRLSLSMQDIRKRRAVMARRCLPIGYFEPPLVFIFSIT